MKTKKIIIISLLVLLLSLSVIEQIFVTRSMDNILNIANNLKSQIESTNFNNEDVCTNLDKLDKEWDKTEYYFCFLISHNDMKEIGDNICSAKNALNQNDKTTLLEKINLVIFYADEYKEIMSFNIQNIL